MPSEARARELRIVANKIVEPRGGLSGPKVLRAYEEYVRTSDMPAEEAIGLLDEVIELLVVRMRRSVKLMEGWSQVELLLHARDEWALSLGVSPSQPERKRSLMERLGIRLRS